MKHAVTFLAGIISGFAIGIFALCACAEIARIEEMMSEREW